MVTVSLANRNARGSGHFRSMRLIPQSPTSKKGPNQRAKSTAPNERSSAVAACCQNGYPKPFNLLHILEDRFSPVVSLVHGHVYCRLQSIISNNQSSYQSINSSIIIIIIYIMLAHSSICFFSNRNPSHTVLELLLPFVIDRHFHRLSRVR